MENTLASISIGKAFISLLLVRRSLENFFVSSSIFQFFEKGFDLLVEKIVFEYLHTKENLENYEVGYIKKKVVLLWGQFRATTIIMEEVVVRYLSTIKLKISIFFFSQYLENDCEIL